MMIRSDAITLAEQIRQLPPMSDKWTWMHYAEAKKNVITLTLLHQSGATMEVTIRVRE